MGLIILARYLWRLLHKIPKPQAPLGALQGETDRQMEMGGWRGNMGVREEEEVERSTHYGEYSRSSVWMSIF